MSFHESLPYIQRIKDYYQALGYGKPYQWAHFSEVPFCALNKPLSDAKIGLVTTASLFAPGKGDQGPGAPYNGAAKFYSVYSHSTVSEPRLFISHIAYDRVHTTATDQGSYFPLHALKALRDQGRFAQLASRFHGLPTNRSQKTTLEIDCVELVSRCIEDGVDAVVLVPNCPVCHQSVSLAARSLEQAGIATVILGCARDIVEHVGVPRFLFNNFPLGNSAGLPHDPRSQLDIASQAVSMLETAKTARTTERSPYDWSGVKDWQVSYSNAKLLSAEEIADRRKEFDRAKVQAKAIRARATTR